MTILDTLKSLLGLESRDRRPETDEEIGVTVEREPGNEPDASTERSVKGVGEPETAEATTAESKVVEEPERAGTREEESTGPADDVDGAEDGDEVDATQAADETEDTGSVDETGEADIGVGTDESPEVLDGIGPAYADRLADAGVETVADLAAADASGLAEEADVSESRLERWIERAKSR